VNVASEYVIVIVKREEEMEGIKNAK